MNFETLTFLASILTITVLGLLLAVNFLIVAARFAGNRELADSLAKRWASLAYFFRLDTTKNSDRLGRNGAR